MFRSVSKPLLPGLALFIACACFPQPLLAQGGPPLVTDDPDTPGNGHWEINLGAIGSHVPGLSQLALPDADINYGWGDHVQLKVDTPWLIADKSGEGLKFGLGTSEVGIKWRFIDAERAGFAMSTYPQVAINFAASSSRRDLTAPGRQWFLPLEASMQLGGFAVDGEVGRSFGTQAADAWVAGLILSHGCGGTLECLAEIHETLAPHDAQTLLNLGARLRLGDTLSLLAALGRDVGVRSDDRQDLSFYLGLQVLR
ncbi:MAG: hypothetical protein JWR07_3979 [Nevskia sp.]|nr:hypothetical protein [Nevskia sp.]